MSTFTATLLPPTAVLRPYQWSGKFKPVALLYCAAVLAGCFLMGLLYSALLHYSPLIYINFLATAFIGVAAGMGICKAILKGHVRSKPLAFGTTVAAGFMIFYAAWIGWVFFLPFADEADRHVWVMNPLDLFFQAAAIAPEGMWSIGHLGSSSGNQNVSGIFLWAIWAIEAAILLAAPWWCTRQTMLELPYSEDGEIWMDQIEKSRPLGPAAHWKYLATLSEVDFLTAVSGLQKGTTTADHLCMELHWSQFHPTDVVLSVKKIAVSYNKKGEREEASTRVVEFRHASPRVIKTLRAALAEIHKPEAEIEVARPARPEYPPIDAPSRLPPIPAAAAPVVPFWKRSRVRLVALIMVLAGVPALMSLWSAHSKSEAHAAPTRPTASTIPQSPAPTPIAVPAPTTPPETTESTAFTAENLAGKSYQVYIGVQAPGRGHPNYNYQEAPTKILLEGNGRITVLEAPNMANATKQYATWALEPSTLAISDDMQRRRQIYTELDLTQIEGECEMGPKLKGMIHCRMERIVP